MTSNSDKVAYAIPSINGFYRAGCSYVLISNVLKSKEAIIPEREDKLASAGYGIQPFPRNNFPGYNLMISNVFQFPKAIFEARIITWL